MCSYKLVLTITKHQTQNIKPDHNLIYLIANATVTTHNKPQRKTTMHPKTFTLFIWMLVFICCFANFFCSSLTPMAYPRQWASSFATIFFNSSICSSYTRMLSSWVTSFSLAAISFYFSSSTFPKNLYNLGLNVWPNHHPKPKIYTSYLLENYTIEINHKRQTRNWNTNQKST